MKNLLRVICCILALVMIISCLPLSAIAADALSTTATCTSATSSNTLNLTEAGNRDWIHYYGSTVSRKYGVEECLHFTDLAASAGVGGLERKNDSSAKYTWTDGATSSSNKVYNSQRYAAVKYKAGDASSVNTEITDAAGYTLEVDSSVYEQTLVLGCGIFSAKGTLSVTVNGEDTVFEQVIEKESGTAFYILTVNIAPSDAVTVKFALNTKYTDQGYLAFACAALSVTSGTEWAMQQLTSFIDKSEALVGYASESTAIELKTEIDNAKTFDGTETFSEINSALISLQSKCSTAGIEANSGMYTYEIYDKLISSFGWEGDIHAPLAYLDGSYRLRDNNDILVTFGVKGISGKINWYNAEGYLPCFISEYSKNNIDYTIANFADKLEINGHAYEIAYSRVTVTNNTSVVHFSPKVSEELVPINDAAKNKTDILPGETVVFDYAIGADRFGGKYDYPEASVLQKQGSYDEHYAHMKNYWNDRLEPLFNIKQLPDERLINAYKAGYIYTMIIRDDVTLSDGSLQYELHIGENGYDRCFDHDIIGIMSTLVTLGDYEYFKEYAKTIMLNPQYPDASWKYSWPFALYLEKTGDIDYINEKFSTIKKYTHSIETDRTGENGIMKQTYAIDSVGYWTIDNWSALMGLTSYKYICEKIGNTTELKWATEQYNLLFEAITSTLQQTITEYNLDYIPASPVTPNDDNRCSRPNDANWASFLMFGRWAWDGYLFGADTSGFMIDMIDDTYTYGFERLAEMGITGVTYGGYPGVSTGYNAGYANSGLAGEKYRDYGIKAYQYMIENTMSGPFGWWEGIRNSTTDSLWEGTHSTSGTGSCQHMWGQSVITKVLIDSLIAEKADGTVIVGRGLSNEWLTDGQAIEIENYPVSGGNMGYLMSVSDKTITISFTGSTDREKSVELLALKRNIVSADGCAYNSATGTVTVPADVDTVVIQMRNNPTSERITEIIATECGKIMDGDSEYNSDNGYSVGDTTVLTAVPDKYCRFDGWYDYDGNLLSRDRNYTVVFESDFSLIAKFSPTTESNVNITVSAGGSVYKDGALFDNDEYRYVSEYIELSAVADSGYAFAAWKDESGNVYSNQPDLSVTLEDSLILTASFVELNYAGSFEITADKGITVEFDKPDDYIVGQYIKLTAVCVDNYEFKGWYDADGALISNSNSFYCEIGVNNSIHAVAVYNNPAILTVTAENGTVTVNGSAYDPSKVYEIGDIVNLLAVADSGYTFLYWTVNDKIMSYNTHLRTKMLAVTNVTAVFDHSSTENRTVTFVSRDNRVVTSITAEVGTDIVLPSLPAAYGYICDGWLVNGEVCRSGEVITLNDNMIIKAQFTAQSETYTVSVSGSDNDSVSGQYSYNEKVSLTYDTSKLPEGSYFAGWANARGAIISYDAKYTFYVGADAELFAVIASEEVSAKPVVAVTDVSSIDNGQKVTFLTERNLPEGYTLVESGVIYTKDFRYASNLTLNTKSDTVRCRRAEKLANNGQLRMTLSSSDNSQITVYLCAFLTYIDADGIYRTVYSNTYSANTVDGGDDGIEDSYIDL